MKGEWDATFEAFGRLNDFIREAFPEIQQYSKRQAGAIHKHADIIAKSLTSGEFSWHPRPSKRNQATAPKGGESPREE